jgi:hypothetical protein
MKAISFERVAGWCAVLAAASGFLYSVSFVVLSRVWPWLGMYLSAKFLMLGGLLALPVMVGLYRRLKPVDESFALLGLLLGVAAALGSVLHGAYDLANALNAPGKLPDAVGNLPSQVDPRGVATFLLAGLAVAVFAGLMGRGRGEWQRLGTTGLVLAALLVIVYLGRLVVLEPTSPLILLPAAVTGFVLNPLWYGWLGSLWLGWRK